MLCSAVAHSIRCLLLLHGIARDLSPGNPGHLTRIHPKGIRSELGASGSCALGVSKGHVEVGLVDGMLHVHYLLSHIGVSEGHEAKPPRGRQGFKLDILFWKPLGLLYAKNSPMSLK